MDGQWMTVSLQKPGEAGRRSSGVSGEPGPPSASWIPECAGGGGGCPAGPGCSPDVSLLRMVFGLLPICWLFGLICQVLGGLHSSVVCWHLGGLTCCAVRRLPEGISAPAVSPVGQFP